MKEYIGGSKEFVINKKSWFYEYMTFRKMNSLIILQVTYIIGMITWTLGGLIAFFIGLSGHSYGSDELIGGGLAVLTLGNLVWRILFEFLIVKFRMLSSVGKIENYVSQIVQIDKHALKAEITSTTTVPIPDVPKVVPEKRVKERFCKHCGTKIMDEDLLYCINCGNPL